MRRFYNKTITASNGTGTLNLAVVETSHVAGFVVPSSGTTSIAITGTPTATGTETFTVTATDSLGSTTNTTYSITVNPGHYADRPPTAGRYGGYRLQPDDSTASNGTGTLNLAGYRNEPCRGSRGAGQRHDQHRYYRHADRFRHRDLQGSCHRCRRWHSYRYL